MRTFTGIDLGSTTTKAVMLDESGAVLGRGITNSRINYDLASAIAQEEARASARFTLLDRELVALGAVEGQVADGKPTAATRFGDRLQARFRKFQHLKQLERLREVSLGETEAERLRAVAGPLRERVEGMLDTMERDVRRPSLNKLVAAEKRTSDFFRDRAASEWSQLAQARCDETVTFDHLMGVFDKAILLVENTEASGTCEDAIRAAFEESTSAMPELERRRCWTAAERALSVPLHQAGVIGTGYGRARLPFPKEAIRSEILCHGLGAHRQYPATRTVLDIGGQDTKAIQVDAQGIVTSFQMNDRCAAGCGRYLGYIADEMSLGVHELGPIAMESTRRVKISSTCTVFAGAELRDRLTNGQKREDILAGLHRAIILRAMSLLARSGGVDEEFTFTGGVANNPAAVRALRQLVEENYGERTLNISPSSIYTGALGAGIFCLRAYGDHDQQAAA